MFRNYIRTAWRNLTKHKIFSIINLVGMAVGLASCVLIILYTRDEVSFDRFHTHAPDIYRVVHDEYGADGKLMMQEGSSGMMPGPSFAKEIPEIKSFVRIMGNQLTVKIGQAVFEQEGHYADENFFSVFSLPLRQGDTGKVLKDLYSVVLSEETARKFFGFTDVLGRTLELPLGPDGAFMPFTISGILPESPWNSSIRLSLLLPMKLNLRDNGGDQEWINFYLQTFVQLHKGADRAKVEAKMKEVYERSAKEQLIAAREKYDFKNRFVYLLQPLTDMHLSTVYPANNGLFGGSNPIYSKILGGIATFILLIACINFVNLSIARSLKRSKEIGIRKVSGGSRQQLILQFLGESFLITLLAFGLAFAIVQWLLPFFNTVANKQLSIGYLFDYKLILLYGGLLLVTAFLAGFYPALVLSGFDPAATLYNRVRLTQKNLLPRALVVLQFGLSTFLIVGTVVIYMQFNHLTTRNLGYDDKNLLILEPGRMNAVEFNTLRNELMRHPKVESIGGRQGGQWFTHAKVEGNGMDFAMEVVTDQYLETLKIPIVQGRGFSADFPGDSAASVLVNEAFVRKAGWSNPIGKEVDFFYKNQKYNVVGVVRDHHYESLLTEINPQLFTKDSQYSYGALMVKLRPGEISSTLKALEQIVRQQRPLQPWKYQFMEETNRERYASEAKWKQILAFGALLTILVSCIGLFGLATLSAEKRQKEIGIRKVLGASVSNVVGKLSVDFLKLVLLAGIISLPLAWWAANNWLEKYPIRIRLSLWLPLATLGIVLLIALLTIMYQAVRAARSSPVLSLRSE